MLSEYKYLIYKDDIEQSQMEDKCLNYILGDQSSMIGQREREIFKTNKNMQKYRRYANYLSRQESLKLFDIAYEKFGKRLWNKDTWLIKSCKRRCPLGNVCKRHFININEWYYCFGQMWEQNIKSDAINQIVANGYQVQIVDSKDNVLFSAKSDKFAEHDEIFGTFFDDYYDMVNHYGDIYVGQDYSLMGRIIGKNAITRL